MTLQLRRKNCKILKQKKNDPPHIEIGNTQVEEDQQDDGNQLPHQEVEVGNDNVDEVEMADLEGEGKQDHFEFRGRKFE